jgi:hypothetical protein
VFRLINRILNLAAILFLGFLLIIALPAFQDPKFRVTNLGERPVKVSVSGSFGKKVIENLKPAENWEFSLEAEGATIFTARFDDGHEIKSQELYFSEGVDMNVNITRNDFEVNYDSKEE